jgi:uncharacterized protein with von Willebrand factor type A (vWA) domain
VWLEPEASPRPEARLIGCLYGHVHYELKIVQTRLPAIGTDLSRQVVKFINALRDLSLSKNPGVAETLDLSRALLLLGKEDLDRTTVEEVLGCVLKSAGDLAKVRAATIDKLLSKA